MIQLFSPYICDEAKAAAIKVLSSGWIGLGPKTEEFEREFAKYCGAKYAVAVMSATAALDLAVRSLDLLPGDEVITTSMTFVSTNHVLLYSGLTPVFVDIDPTTLNLDLDLIEDSITPKTKAIMVVHYAGNPLDLDKLYTIAKKYKLAVIEDAAHACGASYKGRKIGAYGLTCFSFHAVKNLPIGDGGMITTGNRTTYERLLKLRWLGIDRSTYDRHTSNDYKWEYDVRELGTKSHMNDIVAAIGLEQLKHLDEWNGFRKDCVRRYRQNLDSCVEFLRPQPFTVSSNHLCVIKTDNRSQLIEALRQKGIEAGVHNKPNHFYTLYSKFISKGLDATEQVYPKIVSLPLHLGLKPEDINQITRTIKSVV